MEGQIDSNNISDSDLEVAVEADNLSVDEIIQKNVSRNIRDLRTFFSSNNFATEKGDQKTNIINVSEKRTYFVPNTHAETLFTILDSCRKESRMLHYSERQETAIQQLSGIMIDVDRYQRDARAQINERHFDALTRYIGKLLREFIDFEPFAIDGEFIFKVFYIRKPAVVLVSSNLPNETPLYKDGFHILIPEIQISKGLKRHINQELISRGIIKNVFKDIDHIDSADKMLDMMSASNPVHFFGNSKPGAPPYALTRAYEVIFYTAEDDIDRKTLDLAPILDGKIKLSREGEPTPINLTYELSLGTYMPIFGTHPTWLKKRNINYRAGLETKIQTMVEKSSKDILDDEELRRDEEDLSLTRLNNSRAEYVRKLVDLLDISYATDYEKWFKVICAIAHTGTSEDYKLIARTFSKRKPEEWSPAEFERVWSEATNSRFGRKPVTIRSILHWARTSSPHKFDEEKAKFYDEILRKAVYMNEGRVEQASVARICHAMCGDKFVVDVGYNEKTGKMGYCWFEFVTPGQAMRVGEIYKWRKELEPDNVHIFIGEHLTKIYSPVKDSIKDKKDNAENEGIAKYWAGVERNFRLYASKLENDHFQNGIIRQCQYKFRQRGFYDELDSYEDIIGVGNGVLKIGAEPKLIKGFHEYKISKYTETDYYPFDPNNPYIKTLLTAFHDIFLEDDVFEFMMLHSSTGLDARESACILTLLVGGGQNGKTFYAKITHNTLGNMYCAAGKAAILTAPMERSESANSAQMQQKDKRWFYIDEFNKCELLNTARVKSMVTPGWQSGRDLHSRQGNFKNTSNPICLSNFDFIIDTTDHGTWRRIYYYRNKVKFTSRPSPDNPFEKKADSRFIDEYANDPMYKQAMLSIMVHYYTKLCREYKGDLKNVPVPTIERETEQFRNRQDALNRFITQMIVISPCAEEIGVSSLATKYVEWYSSNIKPTNQTVIDVAAQFENSRIAASLERRIGGIMFLVGHRLKSYPEEALQPGEEYLCAATQEPVEYRAALPAVAPKKEIDDDFFRDLVRNAPTHIQNRFKDNIGDDASDSEMVNNFLSAI